MGLYDRDYYRNSSTGRGGGGFGGGGGGIGGDSFGSSLLRALNASFPIGTYLNIRVRVHITFIIVVGLFVLREVTRDAGNPMMMLVFMVMLFGSVLLHEFGHCLACRYVGGTANDILMWPLGGLAYCAPPRRPWPEFLTVVWGPMVNVILCAFCWAILYAMTRNPLPVSFNPFNIGYVAGLGPVGVTLARLFIVNYILLLFNVAMIFYPFDGGRLVQIALWWKFGYVKSMRLATNFGMVGAIAIALFGLAGGETMLVFIAAFGFFACYQQSKMLMHMGPALAEEDRYQASLRPEQPSRADRRRAAAKQKKYEREAREQQAMNEELDRILAKISSEGMGALTASEKKMLQRASDSKRV